MKTAFVFLAAISILALSCSIIGARGRRHVLTGQKSTNLINVVNSRHELTQFAGLIQSSPDFLQLIGKSKFTLLAPTNQALDAVDMRLAAGMMMPENDNNREEWLKKHLVLSVIDSAEIVSGSVKNQLNLPILLGKTRIIESLKVDNGILFILDGLLE